MTFALFSAISIPKWCWKKADRHTMLSRATVTIVALFVFGWNVPGLWVIEKTRFRGRTD